jgi:hypothetical protein
LNHENDDTHEGCVDPIEDDWELATWLESGWYGYVDPIGQFDFDDDLEKEFIKDPWPWSPHGAFLAKWRPIVLDLWRRFRKHL